MLLDFDTTFSVFAPGVVIGADKNVFGNAYSLVASNVGGSIQQSEMARNLALATGLEPDQAAICFADIAFKDFISASCVLINDADGEKWIVHGRPSVRREIADLGHVRVLLQLMLEPAPFIYIESSTARVGTHLEGTSTP